MVYKKLQITLLINVHLLNTLIKFQSYNIFKTNQIVLPLPMFLPDSKLYIVFVNQLDSIMNNEMHGLLKSKKYFALKV